jgi:hypothetical protein
MISVVMPGVVPGIYVFNHEVWTSTWMAGTSPTTTIN